MKLIGGLYVVVWCDVIGVICVVFEDVGCYNVFDKLIGLFVLLCVDIIDGFVFLLSCVSYEFVCKVVWVGILLVVIIFVLLLFVIEIVKVVGLWFVSFCCEIGYVDYGMV